MVPEDKKRLKDTVLDNFLKHPVRSSRTPASQKA